MARLFRKACWYLLAGPLVFLCTAAGAQDDDAALLPPLFSQHDPLEVIIEAPLTTLMDERPDDEYLDGVFRHVAADGTEHEFALKVRTRGKFRRDKESCTFAPLRLNFKKKELAGSEFDGQDKLKLVTHCRTGDRKFEQILLREYVTYRTFSLLTSRSFGVRLLHITYVDTESDSSLVRYGFVIEDDDAMAERLGMERVKTGAIAHTDLDAAQENLVNLFEYMIGNTDFSLVDVVEGEDCCHNSILLSATGKPPYTPVPYDFDFAGLVNAPYAAPNPRFKLMSIRQRLYRGQCRNNELLPGSINHFLKARDNIFAMLDSLDMVTPYTNRQIRSYLEAFYDDISSPRRIRSRLISNCVSPGDP